MVGGHRVRSQEIEDARLQGRVASPGEGRQGPFYDRALGVGQTARQKFFVLRPADHGQGQEGGVARLAPGRVVQFAHRRGDPFRLGGAPQGFEGQHLAFWASVPGQGQQGAGGSGGGQGGEDLGQDLGLQARLPGW
ncbi:MAG: hypothetical protein CMJ87_11450 [Planctomycetes bacterium]|nr:hypothetical protein [Planctomycetota bacterium]